jgi:CheY-like chemotaxis protein
MESSSTADGALLVIEDNANVREALTDALELEGWRVIAASDGREGIELFRQHHSEVALLILDLLMPDLNGAQVLRAVRELDPRIKVIISSGYDESEGLRWLSDRDSVGRPTAFLHKPYTLESLLSLVRQVLAQ